MRISSVQIQGFRNFVDETIEFDNKTLIVGGNDTGKTNLLYALRILFDPSLSTRDLELGNSDFCIYSGTDKIIITARLEDVYEDCLLSAFQGAIKDGVAYVRYSLVKGGDYKLETGFDEEFLEERNGRSYIKHLNLEYVGGNRDLTAFLRRQQNRLLDVARDQRSEYEAVEDAEAVEKIQTSLVDLNDNISSLHYVSESLSAVNDEMSELSIGNVGYKARLVAGNTDADKLLGNLQLAYLSGDSPLVFGGDGRGNQLYFATWLSEQRIKRQQEKVSIFAIEEPEAHLHPHQQRKLAEYLSTFVSGQVLITTHSPQIAERFTNGRVLRLMSGATTNGTVARGCNSCVDAALSKLGYRLNAISSEVFFSSGVLLVEGPSERIFYLALAEALGIDFDRHNITILAVDGVGFEPYVRACIALGIPFALRTDDDVFGVSTMHRQRLAGVQRLTAIAKQFFGDDADLDAAITRDEEKLSWADGDEMPECVLNAKESLAHILNAHGLFLSLHKDLEHDLAESAIREQLIEYFSPSTEDKLVSVMQRRKAENMHGFIDSNPDLTELDSDSLSAPLKYVVNLVAGGLV